MITIPVDSFDQSKLEYLLRSSPVAYVREEAHENFVRRFYQFPEKRSSFQINCYGNHYKNAPVPSEKKCTVKTSARSSGDEISIVIENTGLPPRKLYSTERVYGQSFNGNYRQLFRYMFDCNQATCKITFATKEPTP